MIGFIPVVLGLASAVAWGAADFTGGLAAKRTNVFGVVIMGEAVGMVLITILAVIQGEPIPHLRSWALGGVAGISGGVGILILYRALASGQMSVAAPISGVVAAIIPVIFNAGVEGLPGSLTLTGFVLALAAVWLISRNADGTPIHLKILALPAAAGVTFGLFFICMHQASQFSTFWPIVASRSSSMISLLVFVVITRQPWQPQRPHWPLIALNGLMDVAGNVFFIQSGQIGRLDVAAVLGSLYPGSTVLLASMLLKERINRLQTIGILLALIAIGLIAL